MVSGLTNPRLLGLENGYLYWLELPLDVDGPPDTVMERVLRVKKEGGAPELVVKFEGPEVPSHCGIASAGGELLFVLHARETGDDQLGRIVAVGKPGAAPVPRTSDRPGLCNILVRDGRLIWTEDSGLWSAKLDGADAKRLWSTPANATIRRVAARDQNLIVFLATGAARPEAQGLGSLGSLGSLGHGRREDRGAQVVQVSPKGKATTIWRGSQLLKDGAVHGGDLLVCDEGGLVRIPKNGKAATTIIDNCQGAHPWHDWQLDWRGGPLAAIPFAPPPRVIVVIPKVSMFAGAILSDDAVYACSDTKKPEACDLVRLPGRAWFEHLPALPREP